MIAIIAFVAILPVFVFLTLLLWVSTQGNPFFIQLRPGKNAKLFRVIKFKTMNDKKDSSGNLLSDDQRLTALGKFVRKTSLDEIPQLLNVIAGNMSLIGPRPLLPEYLSMYSEEQLQRHLVRPGITGWAQIHGRNAITWQDKFKLDVWYVQHLNFWLDIKIIFITFIKVLKASGISGKGVSTVEKFNGKN